MSSRKKNHRLEAKLWFSRESGIIIRYHGTLPWLPEAASSHQGGCQALACHVTTRKYAWNVRHVAMATCHQCSGDKGLTLPTVRCHHSNDYLLRPHHRCWHYFVLTTSCFAFLFSPSSSLLPAPPYHFRVCSLFLPSLVNDSSSLANLAKTLHSNKAFSCKVW